MKLTLPNGTERELRNDICIEDKVGLCDDLIIEFEEYLLDYKDKPSVQYFLNGMANYLCWHKEDVENYRDHDKDRGILSNEREKLIERNKYHSNYRKDKVFTDLSMNDNLYLFGEVE